MPRHPLGDKAKTDAERQRRRRERLRQERGPAELSASEALDMLVEAIKATGLFPIRTENGEAKIVIYDHDKAVAWFEEAKAAARKAWFWRAATLERLSRAYQDAHPEATLDEAMEAVLDEVPFDPAPFGGEEPSPAPW